MKDILSYESDIWSCADLLISSGIKQSKFPDYMMPFFALIMLEGRMRNEMRDIEENEGIHPKDNIEDFVEAFRDRECGYNDYIVRQGKTLRNTLLVLMLNLKSCLASSVEIKIVNT